MTGTMQLALDPVMILVVAGAVALLRPLFRGAVDGPRRVFGLAIACAAAALAYRLQDARAVRLDDAIALACAAIGGVTLLDRVGPRGAQAIAGKGAGGLGGALAALASLAAPDVKTDSDKPQDAPAAAQPQADTKAG